MSPESPRGKHLVEKTSELSSIVSFSEFEKFIINIFDIVWMLKLNDPEYSYKGFEDSAFEYYLAFYLKPEIREKYSYLIAPCTTAIRDRILALPNQEDRKTLLQMKDRGQRVASYQYDITQPTLQAELVDVVAEEDKE